MSLFRSIPAPGAGRITLALLAVVPAVLAHPWGAGGSKRGYWMLGIAAVVVILLFGWWHGLHLTTLLRRRLAMRRRRRWAPDPDSRCGDATRATLLLRVRPPLAGSDALPLPLIARYLNCYGIRADAIRITSHDRETWIGLTVSAVTNLAALQARSSRIPLQETAQVAARRFVDHLREIGWEVNTAGVDEILPLFGPGARETWRGMVGDEFNYVAAYQVNVAEGLPETLDAIRSYPADETWIALEIAGDSASYTIAAVCAFRTDARPEIAVPLAGLTPQRGNHLPALLALDPLSTQRLDGHTGVPADLLKRLDWPVPAGEAQHVAEKISPT